MNRNATIRPIDMVAPVVDSIMDQVWSHWVDIMVHRARNADDVYGALVSLRMSDNPKVEGIEVVFEYFASTWQANDEIELIEGLPQQCLVFAFFNDEGDTFIRKSSDPSAGWVRMAQPHSTAFAICGDANIVRERILRFISSNLRVDFVSAADYVKRGGSFTKSKDKANQTTLKL